jgi:S1-C subfamily serine protease
VTAVDVAIVCFTILMAAVGWRQGFLVGALSLAGFALGALLGTRLASAVVAQGSASPYAPLFGLIGAVMGGGLLAVAMQGMGLALRRRLWRAPGLGLVDGALGAVLLAALALAIAWLAGAVALQTPGARQLRADIQRSAILRKLNNALPPSGSLLNALARFDPFPQINGPRAEVAAPPKGIARDPDIQAAGASVVRVTGTACGLGVEGSGWVVEDGLVVTNAHVVAGEDDTTVQVRGEGSKLPAEAVYFDPRNDLAILRVGNLNGVPALRLATDTSVETPGAILGFPRNGPYDVRPARLGPTQTVLSEDAYGQGPVTRTIVSFRGLVRPGNSGGPVVNRNGRVLTTVFAASRGNGPHTGYGVPNAVVRDALVQISADTVGTGACAA